MYATLSELNIGYDQDHDILYVTIGAPVPSYCDEDNEGVLFRKSTNSHKLSGVTIMDFSKKTELQLQRILPIEIDVKKLYKSLPK